MWPVKPSSPPAPGQLDSGSATCTMDPFNLQSMCPKYLALKKVRYGMRNEKGLRDQRKEKLRGEDGKEMERNNKGGDRKAEVRIRRKKGMRLESGRGLRMRRGTKISGVRGKE